MVFCKSAILESDTAIFRGTVLRRSPFLMGKEGGGKFLENFFTVRQDFSV